MDLFEIAENNARSLESRFESIKDAKDPTEVTDLARFADKVLGEGRISINMRSWQLSHMLAHGKHLNIHELSQQQADLSGTPVATILRKNLGRWHDGRVAFDAAFIDGNKFRYGALNMGGGGVIRHGQFCNVLRAEFPPPGARVAYLPADSLSAYVDSGGNIDENALREDAAPHSHRHYLTAIKHADDIATTVEDQWPTMVCSNSGYVEAVFVENVTNDAIDQVRVTKKEYKKLWGLAFADHGRELPEGARALGQDFVQILQSLGDLNVALERVSDD